MFISLLNPKFMSRMFLLIVLTCHTQYAYSASIIRDAEIESVLRDVTSPILTAANLSPQNVRLYIIQNPEINAYVTGGQNIFIHTGLMQLSENPSMLMGVLAHESGHIAGGHLTRIEGEFENTAIKTTVGFLLGIAATAAGSPEAGQAIIAGTDHITRRQLLKHTRTQEESADQAALSYLDKINYSAKGLLDLLEILYNKENTLYSHLNPYTLTHPLSQQRIEHIKNHLSKTSQTGGMSPELIARYRLGIIKLKAFLSPPDITLAKYKPSDTSEAARYARAIAYYRTPNLKKSLAEINSLIADYPQNPYYPEFKGQLLLDNGRVKESIPLYEKAKALLPQSDLLKIELANAYLATEDNHYATLAIDNLRIALRSEKDNSFLWHQLAVAYGRNQEFGLSNLASAEKTLLEGNTDDAQLFVDRADAYIKPGTPADLQRQDLMVAIDRQKQQNKRLRR